MIQIQKLLSRIRWDASFAKAFFEIEYNDRVVGNIRISLNEMVLLDSFAFSIKDRLNRTITIPLHRIKCVYRNGEIIWRRP